ncbi:MAG: DUF3662 domain-containing protein [Anaerolineae bacterium]|nr:DUF3662 domain-containing protein [Anaerolineae bacterium]
MKSLQTGFAPVRPPVAALAEELLESFPSDIILLLGLSLAEPQADVDLIALTPSVAVVGIDAGGPAAISPQLAGQRIATIQQQADLPAPLPVYVCWLGETAPPGHGDATPALTGAESVQHYILQAAGQHSASDVAVVGRVADLLLSRERAAGAGRRTPPLRRALRALGSRLDAGLLEHLTPLRFGRGGGAVRPADINRHLEAAMLDRQNLLEDVNYGKIVPNEYLVEVGPETYEHRFRPLAGDLTSQWQRRLLDALNTANGRQGSRVYRFGGPVVVHLRPAADVPEDEVRIRSRVNNEQAVAAAVGIPCLQRLPRGRSWPLQGALVTMGRSRQNDIYLDEPEIQERRLVSSQHAYLRCRGDHCHLYDGSPDGKPSLNGTYVNGKRLGQEGRLLRDGDTVVLAASDPQHPSPDAPGVAGFVFRASCAAGAA